MRSPSRTGRCWAEFDVKPEDLEADLLPLSEEMRSRANPKQRAPKDLHTFRHERPDFPGTVRRLPGFWYAPFDESQKVALNCVWGNIVFLMNHFERPA